MNKEGLDFVLQEGEGQFIEFKEKPDSRGLAKEMTAFANSRGGKIFLGVSDEGKVKGINSTNELKSQIQDIANNCDPSVKIHLDKIGDVLVVEVMEGNNKPHKCSEGFFVRIGPNSQKMGRDDIVSMVLSLGSKRFDEVVSDVKDYDEKLVDSFLKQAGIKYSLAVASLFNLGAADEKGRLNNAGILFFTSSPKKYLVNAFVSCVRYKGTERVNVIDRKDFEGDVVSQVENSIEFVIRNTMLSYEIKGIYRKDIPEYPVEAVREAILNAVMHRDYFEKGANVQVDVFDDRLVVTNIGSLIKPLTKEKLGQLAIRRNPIIAELFHRIHLVEKIGSGINRIKEECKKHGGVKFNIESNGYFISEFKLTKNPSDQPQKKEGASGELGEKLGEGLGEPLGENEARIFNEIRKDRNVTAERLSVAIGISATAVENNIAKLKQKGFLRRVGPDKGGYWEVTVQK